MSTLDQQVRATLIEMNRKKKIRSHVFKSSHENVKRRLKAHAKVKQLVKTAKEISSQMPDCTLDCTRSFCYELFPFYRILRNYSLRKNLLSDFLAGLTVGIVHIPQGKITILNC